MECVRNHKENRKERQVLFFWWSYVWSISIPAFFYAFEFLLLKTNNASYSTTVCKMFRLITFLWVGRADFVFLFPSRSDGPPCTVPLRLGEILQIVFFL